MDDKLLTIIDTSGMLFRKYGIRSISMDDISRELGMSKKTLYQ
ncbi:TetR/AcrR family transcriptional regulator, partial [Lentimicrobium sp.]